jgi:small subunit ribosomal protein S20
MPNIKSAKKRMVQNEKRRQRNVARNTAVKTAMKKVLIAIEDKNDPSKVKDLLREAEAKIARAKRKVYHPNTAARKISRLAKRVADYTKEATK